MAVTSAELKKLQKQVSELQKLLPQVTQLQDRVSQLEEKKNRKRQSVRKSKQQLTERERVRALLRQAGLTREPTAREKQMAARWRALPDAEKEQVIRELRQVRIDPPLSQLIHEMR